MAEEEAAALSTWAVASLCGSLRLDNVISCFSYFLFFAVSVILIHMHKIEI
jgi:hypothetical protein